MYAFNLTTGDLTHVSCGTATPAANGTSNRLWIDSPSIMNDGLGDLQRGYSADRSDSKSAYPDAAAAAVHRFTPPSVNAFTVTSNASAASIGFRHHKAWLHNPAE